MNFGSMSTCHCFSFDCARAAFAPLKSSSSANNTNGAFFKMRNAAKMNPTGELSRLEITRASPKVADFMITFLEGTLAEALPTHVVVAVHGVGYQAQIPLS